VVVPGAHRQEHPTWQLPTVSDLIASIEDYLRANNDYPKPLVWTATAESILEKVRRGRVALDRIVAIHETHH
jgi:hypothetical protein